MSANRTAAVLALAHFDELRARAFATNSPWPMLPRLAAAENAAEALSPAFRDVPTHLRGWFLHPDYHPFVDVYEAAAASLMAEGSA